ncbi:methyl transferase [Xylogone sp. PMI_703]|nr:methyl transferase [Xylogone sp. PMI_703]
MPQNIYDSPPFFAAYALMSRSLHGLSSAPEWPHLRALLPPSLAGLRILDLGCGFGWFSRYAIDHGDEGTSVLGIDISENMLARAREMTTAEAKYEGRIKYVRGDLDDLEGVLSREGEGEEGRFDVVFSSLAVHYLVELESLVRTVFKVLKPGGVFVFSAEHPIFTAPSRPGVVSSVLFSSGGAGSGAESGGKSGDGTDSSNDTTGSAGNTDEKEKEKDWRYWPLDAYQKEGQRITNWLADGVVKQHRTVATYINLLLDAGFQLTGFEEWCPTKEQLEQSPEWGDEVIRPTFMLVRGSKPRS